MEKAILLLCENRYVMPRELAELLQRDIKTLRNQYISKLVRQGKLVLQFPGQRTHPAQAYQSSITADKGENHDT